VTVKHCLQSDALWTSTSVFLMSWSCPTHWWHLCYWSLQTMTTSLDPTSTLLQVGCYTNLCFCVVLCGLVQCNFCWDTGDHSRQAATSDTWKFGNGLSHTIRSYVL